MADFEAILKKSAGGLDSETGMNSVKSMAAGLTKRPTSSSRFIDSASAFLEGLDESCVVCERMTRIMDRYADVVLWMYFKDSDFRKRIVEGKGFCLPHYKLLLQSAKKYLSPKNRTVFVSEMNALMKSNMDRILKDVQWFAQKFDYRNKSASWGTAKDAVPRAIGKITSYSDLK
jgi:transposase